MAAADAGAVAAAGGMGAAEFGSAAGLAAGASAAAPAAATSWLPYLSAGTSILGAGTSVLGTLGKGDAAAQTAAYQSQIARNNAIAAQQQADAEIAAGQRQAEMKSLETASRTARLRVGMAANGVDISTGSAVDVQASERELGEIDAETALSNSALKAYGYRQRATSSTAQASLDQATAGNARTGSYLDAGGTLLSKASQLPLLWRVGSGTGSTATA